MPDWLFVVITKALLGEVYPAIRAIAVRYSPEENTLLLRAYLDREPTEDDNENIAIIETNIFAMTTRAEIASSQAECVHTNAPHGRLDPLDGFVFARSEIAPGVPYLEGPYSWSD
ncbi:MAG: colicin [Ancylobacter novellus]|uniref:Colicin n=1 Tax=Ancylobacter novellus TaxID=921 RepID=A0A2W5KPL5_ANCNO|nr:MAG: colicin [Ancylobacter novellus]